MNNIFLVPIILCLGRCCFFPFPINLLPFFSILTNLSHPHLLYSLFLKWSLIYSSHIRLGPPIHLLSEYFSIYTFFATLSFCILNIFPNQLNCLSSIDAIFRRFLISLFLVLSLLILFTINPKNLISVALNLLLLLFKIRLSQLYVNTFLYISISIHSGISFFAKKIVLAPSVIPSISIWILPSLNILSKCFLWKIIHGSRPSEKRHLFDVLSHHFCMTILVVPFLLEVLVIFYLII